MICHHTRPQTSHQVARTATEFRQYSCTTRGSPHSRTNWARSAGRQQPSDGTYRKTTAATDAAQHTDNHGRRSSTATWTYLWRQIPALIAVVFTWSSPSRTSRLRILPPAVGQTLRARRPPNTADRPEKKTSEINVRTAALKYPRGNTVSRSTAINA